MNLRTLFVIGVVTPCIGLVFGCGGSGQNEEEAIKESVASYFKGFAAGDGEMVCSQMTASLAESRGEKLADGLPWLDTTTCESTIEGLAEVAAPSGVVTSVQVEGDSATAYLNKGTKVKMIKEDGQWLISSGFLER